MRLIKGLFVFLFFAICMQSCKFKKNKEVEQKKEPQENILTGTIDVLVDESILSIIDEQKEVFEASYPNSRVNLIAKPEILAVNSLLNGEADFAILSRTLTKDEGVYFEQRSVRPRIFPVASEGLVLFTSTKNDVSKITIEEISALLNGEKTDNFSHLFFENINSSIFRQLKELNDVKKVSGTFVKETRGLENMISHVLSQDGTLGVMSFDEYRSIKKTFSEINKIRILSVQNSRGDKADGEYYLPTQSTFGLGVYPLSRTIYVMNYQPRIGLGIGWSAFLTGDRGQRVFLKAELLPHTMPGREIIIREKVI